MLRRAPGNAGAFSITKIKADIVLGSGGCLRQMYLDQWFAFMAGNVGADEVRDKRMAGYTAEDRPAATVHLKWLAEAGFQDVDVVWKYYNFAVFGGRKPNRGEARFPSMI